MNKISVVLVKFVSNRYIHPSSLEDAACMDGQYIPWLLTFKKGDLCFRPFIAYTIRCQNRSGLAPPTSSHNSAKLADPHRL
jgi:hypothetical protein